MKTIFIVITVLFPLTIFYADIVHTNIPSITVTAIAQTAKNAAIHNVLHADPNVMLNSQGGSQHDLSVRGSSFSGAGLSLAGLTLRNPQTEHFNAELPIPATLLSRPITRTGLANQGGHLVGTVNFDFLPIVEKKQIEVGFGSDHRNEQSVQIEQMLTDKFCIGIFAGRESANDVDYDDNDNDRNYVGGHLQLRTDESHIDFLIAHQKKKFDARGYYGVDDTKTAKEKIEDTFINLSATKGDLNANYFRGGILWRTFCDEYTIPAWRYENHHRSRVMSAFLDSRTLEINGWGLGWRVDVDEERITGSLGNHHRTHGGFSLLPQWSGDRLKITAGLRHEFFTGKTPYYLPQAGVEHQIFDNLTTFASYSESVRLPSFTELNYDSPVSLGNSGLKPQTAAQAEIGLKGIPSEGMDWQASVFHRRSKNTIDWMKKTSTTSWQATDIGNLDLYGLEAHLGWYPAQNIEMQFAYTWIYKDRTSDDFEMYASRYALDYPKHFAKIFLLWRPNQTLEIGTVQALRLQTSNKVRRHGPIGIDSSFVVRFTPPGTQHIALSLLLNHAYNDDFQTFPGQRPSNRFAEISLTLE